MASATAAYGIGIAMTILSGITMALQTGVNATLGAACSRPFSSLVSFITGLICCAIYFLLDVTVFKGPLPTVACLKPAPWWSWFGGPLGAFYVVIVIIFAHRLGAATLTAVFVSSMLTASLGLDLLGAAGFARRKFSWPRALGVALMVVGVVLVTQFPGALAAQRGGARLASAPAAQGSGGPGPLRWPDWARLQRPARSKDSEERPGAPGLVVQFTTARPWVEAGQHGSF